jgi:hypothetical protein
LYTSHAKLSTLLLCGTIALSGCIAKDKQMHFGVGVITSGIAYAATGDTKAGWKAASGIGLAKEVYDSTGRGSVEVGDFVATAAGAAVWELVDCLRFHC